MTKRSKQWLKEHRRDLYVRQARDSHYRSRAAYKLMEIDRRDRLFRPGQTVVDLGAAPGSWSQYAAAQVGPGGRVIALDRLAMEPLPGVQAIQGDFTEETALEACLAALEGRGADLVLSDMAPNLSGIRATDQVRSLYLAELALAFARQVLRPGGGLLVKVFQGPETDRLRRELSAGFQKVSVRKPRASRASSREFYILARSGRL